MQYFASSYPDTEMAQRAIDHLIGLDKHQMRIDTWVSSGLRRPLVLEGAVPVQSVGIILGRADVASGRKSHDTNEAKLVLKAARQMPDGYRVHTSYPILRLPPPEIDDTYPNLFQLFGGYFHQDWAEDYEGSPQAVLDDYVASCAPFEIEETIAEIGSLVAVVSSEDALRELLLRFDNNYVYDEHAGFSPSMWFETIATRLRIG